MSQGQRSRSNLQLSEKNCLGYKSGTDDCILIKLILRIHIHATLKVTKGQGHKVKGQGQRSRYVKNNDLGFKSRTNDRIVVKLMHRVDIDATLKVTKGQGHKVKGQGQKYSFTKNCFGYISLMIV